MYYKIFRPIICDFIVMVIISLIVVFGTIYNGWVKIVVLKNNLTMFTLLMFCIFYALQILNKTIFFGIRAIMDLLFQNYSEIKCTYVKQVATRNAFFSERIKKDIKGDISKIRNIYYDVIVEYKGKRMSLIATEPIFMNENSDYIIKIGKTSKVIIAYENKPKTREIQ